MASVKCFVLFFTLLLVAHSFARPGGNTGGKGSNGESGSNGRIGNNVGNGNNISYMNKGGNSNNVDNGNVGSNNNQNGGHIVSNIQGERGNGLRITNEIYGNECNNNC
ncbi:nacrein-like protein M [Leptopilina boulardi]|uniref:nacrein-like protein M n=1 Tax=Leptopilina boulardi TaxID=63433 RepID=UPI0021F560B4|nr:nacrein-like protein M [Leptopilina boulardi]XP_051166832.1 nacrein-like protein M [Leptopilina boulardi]